MIGKNKNSSNQAAPVIVFAYRRAAHLKFVLDALSRERLAKLTNVKIYVDGPKTIWQWIAVKKVILEASKKRNFMSQEVVVRKKNLGLAQSIVSGVTETILKTGRAIVLEDDIVPLSGFLAYMNTALSNYQDKNSVMAVSATQFANSPPKDDRVHFLPFTSSWGWATWERAWKYFPKKNDEIKSFLEHNQRWHSFNLQGAYPFRQLLVDSISENSDTWAVRWYYSCFRRKGLVLYPPTSYVVNIGKDGSGCHDRGDQQKVKSPKDPDKILWPHSVKVDHEMLKKNIIQLRKLAKHKERAFGHRKGFKKS